MGTVLRFTDRKDFFKAMPCSDCREICDVNDMVLVQREPAYSQQQEVRHPTIKAYVCNSCASEGGAA